MLLLTVPVKTLNTLLLYPSVLTARSREKKNIWHLSGLELATNLSKRFQKLWQACVPFTWVMLLNSGCSHWDICEQFHSSAFASPWALQHLCWTLSPSSGSLCSAFVGIMWCHFSVPMPVRVLSFQACWHSQMPGHLPLLISPLLLLPSDSCQYIF